MRKILKKGTKTKAEDITYFMKCKTCGCEFTYQLSDIRWDLDLNDIVDCPDCEWSCYIFYKKKYKGERKDESKKC